MVLGIYLFEMTTNENVKADGFDYVDGIYLFEMTTIENNYLHSLFLNSRY